GGSTWATVIVSPEAVPLNCPRNAIQPSPAAVGAPMNPGPAKIPPPGAASPRAATVAFEAAFAPTGNASKSAHTRGRTANGRPEAMRKGRGPRSNGSATEPDVLVVGSGWRSRAPARLPQARTETRTRVRGDGYEPPNSHQPAGCGRPVACRQAANSIRTGLAPRARTTGSRWTAWSDSACRPPSASRTSTSTRSS